MSNENQTTEAPAVTPQAAAPAPVEATIEQSVFYTIQTSPTHYQMFDSQGNKLTLAYSKEEGLDYKKSNIFCEGKKADIDPIKLALLMPELQKQFMGLAGMVVAAKEIATRATGINDVGQNGRGAAGRVKDAIKYVVLDSSDDIESVDMTFNLKPGALSPAGKLCKAGHNDLKILY